MISEDFDNFKSCLLLWIKIYKNGLSTSKTGDGFVDRDDPGANNIAEKFTIIGNF